MPERVRAKVVANITGLSLRAVQNLAIRGKIPSAAKFGAVWTFNEKAIREWVQQLEVETVSRAAPVGSPAAAVRNWNALSRSQVNDQVDRLLGMGKYAKRKPTARR